VNCAVFAAHLVEEKLLDTLGSLGRDAVYTNRVFDADDLTGAGYIPSQLPSGF
jgi:hypothetical protein